MIIYVELWKTCLGSKRSQRLKGEHRKVECRKGQKRSEAIESLGWVRIEEVSGSVKRVSPINRGD